MCLCLALSVSLSRTHTYTHTHTHTHTHKHTRARTVHRCLNVQLEFTKIPVSWTATDVWVCPHTEDVCPPARRFHWVCLSEDVCLPAGRFHWVCQKTSVYLPDDSTGSVLRLPVHCSKAGRLALRPADVMASKRVSVKTFTPRQGEVTTDMPDNHNTSRKVGRCLVVCGCLWMSDCVWMFVDV